MQQQQQPTAKPSPEVMPLLNPIYPQKYLKLFEQLKILMQKQQFTIEANKLAEELIPYLEGNYNCWYVKKMCIKKGVIKVQNQIQYSRNVLLKKVKNFQIWDYRRFLTQYSQNYEDQYELIQEALNIEFKNYHAWGYRAWVVNQAKNYQEELKKIEKYHQKDINNNSVWSYRFYIVTQLIKQNGNRKKILNNQILGAIQKLQKNCMNESLWNYLRGFFPSIKLKQFKQKPTILSYQQFPQILAFCNKIVMKTQCDSHSTQPLVTLVHIHSHSQIQYAKNTCQILIQKQKQKQNYWRWIKNSM